MDMQCEFLRYLRFKRSLLACDEVSSYGCIADVLAVDKNKKHVLEYEFKCSSQDLKVNEKKKYKYQQQYKYVRGRRVKSVYKQPHRFYYVVPEELYRKEKAYLESQNCGIIMYSHFPDRNWVSNQHQFLTMKPCRLRKKNLQKYEVASRDILRRCTSAYVTLLDNIEQMKEWHQAEIEGYKKLIKEQSNA